MHELNIFHPETLKADISSKADFGNYASIVPIDTLIDMRNTQLISVQVRRAMQEKPFNYFNGAAEHLMLKPLVDVLATQHSSKRVNVLEFMVELARNSTTVARILNSAKSTQAVGSIANFISGILPDPTKPNAYDWLRKAGTGPGAPAPSVNVGYETFTLYLHSLVMDPTTRLSIEKVLTSPGATAPGPVGTYTSSITIINEMLNKVMIFGTVGRGSALINTQIESMLEQRFLAESFITTKPSSRLQADSVFAAGLWYLMYCDVTRTPESYDASFPIIDLTANNPSTVSSIISKFGTLTKSSYYIASAPSAYMAWTAHRQLSELVEFLAPVSKHTPELVSKFKGYADSVASALTDYTYAPLRQFANVNFDYFKKLTGSRYLLPDWVALYQSIQTGYFPFQKMPNPMLSNPPAGYRGYLTNAQSATELNAMDVPVLMEMCIQKMRDLKMYTAQLSQTHDSLVATLPQPSGDVFVHLANLSSTTEDPALGTIHYPEMTRTYTFPTHFPRFVRSASGTFNWSLDGELFRPFFQAGKQLSQAITNLSQPKFAWDVEVNLEAGPSTGIDFAYLPIPSEYVDDCFDQVVSNDMPSFKQFLSSLKYRPLNNLSDYFIPLFQALSIGLTKGDVIANALSSVGFLFKRTNTGTGAFNDAKSWTRIDPQIPFIYGHPTLDIAQANSPFTTPPDPRAVCGPQHCELSPDGRFMFVLHRLVPKPAQLDYIPFVLNGGLTIALPIASRYYTPAIAAAIADLNSAPDVPVTAEALWAKFYGHLSSASMKKTDYQYVSSWARAISPFPHIFVTNRDIRHAWSSPGLALPTLPLRYSLAFDGIAPFGSVLQYYTYQPYLIDVLDMLKVGENPGTMDLQSSIKSLATKSVAGPGGDTARPETKHADVELIDTVTPGSEEQTVKTDITSGKLEGDLPIVPPGAGAAPAVTPGIVSPTTGKVVDKKSTSKAPATESAKIVKSTEQKNNLGGDPDTEISLTE